MFFFKRMLLFFDLGGLKTNVFPAVEFQNTYLKVLLYIYATLCNRAFLKRMSLFFDFSG